MRKILNIVPLIGLILLLAGYLVNPVLLSIAKGNLFHLTDNGPGISSYKLVPVSDNNSYEVSDLTQPIRYCFYVNANEPQKLTDKYDYLANIGKYFYFDTDPAFTDLIDLKELNIMTIGKVEVRKQAATALNKMLTAIYTANITAEISSGYRSIATQKTVYNSWAFSVGYAKAYLYAARPGFSEHELGTTVDILTTENELKLLPSYTRTKLFRWLTDNAINYGFTESYPENKTTVTGFSYEPWHYRYVGVDLAIELKKQGLTLTEYLLNQANYCLTTN